MNWWIRKQFLRIKLYLSENYQKETESLVIWYAVCYAAGMAFYFALKNEPSVWLLVSLLEIAFIILYLIRHHSSAFKVMCYITSFLLGLCIAKADAMYQATKVEKDITEISYLYGKIEDIDINSSGRTRLTLDDVDDFEHAFKGKFRISINQKLSWLKEGICVEMIAKMPHRYTPDPLGNYNLERANFYKDISAVGYAVSPVFETPCEAKKKETSVQRFKNKITAATDSYSAPPLAAIIKALTIGDKGDITPEQYATYRTAGLAHVLAISGMHMGLIALLIFFLVRVLLLPIGKGRYDLRKPAAVVSLLLTFAYFLISGQSISCRRAFIMTALILAAVILNRRAISMRLWALALLTVCTISPSSVISAGFLMSFAATLGLISFYEKNSARLKNWYAKQNIISKIATYITGVIMTDLIASLMTLPYSIYFFRQISMYTTVGNILAAPLIAFGVMPSILLFLLSVPLGVESYVLPLLNISIEWLNNIAIFVSSLKGARSGEGIEVMPEWGIILTTIGLLWLCIWQQKWRYWGIAVIALGLSSMITSPQADFVFDTAGTTFVCRADDGKLHPTPWHKNKYLLNKWKGNEDISPTLKCDKNSCFCGADIEFKKGEVKWKNKPVSLHQSGYISHKHGLKYSSPVTTRIWNK